MAAGIRWGHRARNLSSPDANGPNPSCPTNGLPTVLLTERGYASGATSCCLNAQRSVPAATAAVSARRTVGPSPTVSNPASSSALSQPPSGPMATTGWPRCGGPPPGLAKVVGLPVREARDPSVETSATSGNQARRLWAAASRATRRSRSTDLVARIAFPANYRSSGEYRHDPVHTQLGELLHHPLGAVTLGRGEGHGDRWLGQRGQLHRAVEVQAGTGVGPAGVRVSPAGDHATASPSSGSVTGHHDLAGPQSEYVDQVMAVGPAQDRAAGIVDEHHGRGVHRCRAEQRALRPVPVRVVRRHVSPRVS